MPGVSRGPRHWRADAGSACGGDSPSSPGPPEHAWSPGQVRPFTAVLANHPSVPMRAHPDCCGLVTVMCRVYAIVLMVPWHQLQVSRRLHSMLPCAPGDGAPQGGRRAPMHGAAGRVRARAPAGPAALAGAPACRRSAPVRGAPLAPLRGHR